MNKRTEELLSKYRELEAMQRNIIESILLDCHQSEEDQYYIEHLKEENQVLKEINTSLKNKLDFCREERELLVKIVDECKAENAELKRSREQLYSLIIANREFDVSSFTRREGVRLDEYYGVIGILFADYDSIPVREYIADYLMLFNSKSADYIDFLLPGYCNKKTGSIVNKVSLNGKQLYFDKEAFSRSVLNYREFFGLDYLDRPVLVLHELNNGKVSPRRIVLELEYKETKELFDKIIDIAKQHTDITDFSSELKKKYLFCMFPKFLKVVMAYLGIDIDEAKSVVEGVYRFRVKGS